MARGMSLADRQALRQKYREQAIANADRLGRTIRCRDATAMAGADEALIRAHHRACLGESPGGAGCLCECHDDPGSSEEGEPGA